MPFGWMPGSSPGMTDKGMFCLRRCTSLNFRTGFRFK
jgi:hypothetical protein